MLLLVAAAAPAAPEDPKVTVSKAMAELSAQKGSKLRPGAKVDSMVPGASMYKVGC